ncbi:NAD(P)-dependent alcohol dehydrogenase [Streptomyces canus]|uniref:NAD(P)-dependent alcohol dehydrogenase n=1 Tax=Streptomyces canus TaxID=58343 RepID=UPI0027872797|nr:NAD(P)-dependent alcohol dehydrogenase [Streptomyces canus]MDQ0757551.1 putative zinc-type alcohol dehydrogenase-like protein [Streptomyces canus]MDQ1073750.1 putative zinc-type alcohol dehydrogenase-like protein [Streptomyces canus]
MRSTTGWQADSTTRTLRRAALERRDLRPDDIAVRVEYCGVCYTDLHALQAHESDANGVLVPGHEFTGVVTEVGSAVPDFSPGDPVAVGNIVDSCRMCRMCQAGQENFCREFPTLTYGGADRQDGATTLGGYSREYVVSNQFAYHLPAGLDPAATAPLLCAGVTVWEPLQALGVGPGSTVAVAGLGGLGHLAVKMATGLGATTSVISQTPDKADEARGLGAQGFVVSTDPKEMEAVRDQFDVIIDTISAPHDLAPYLRVAAMDGTLSHLGHLGPVTVETMDLLIGRKKLSSAGSGGRPSTAAMLHFCAERGITADIELLPSSQVNRALERLARNDVRYRFVLDMSDLD